MGIIRTFLCIALLIVKKNFIESLLRVAVAKLSKALAWRSHERSEFEA